MSIRRSAISKIELLVVFGLAIFLGLVTAYYIAGKRSADAVETVPPTPAPTALSDEDRQLVEKQKICPVSGGKLGSMGDPFRTEVDGKTVFVCCPNCTNALKKDPGKYLEKLK